MYHDDMDSTKKQLKITEKTIKKMKTKIDKSRKSAFLAVDIAEKAKIFSKFASQSVETVVKEIGYVDEDSNRDFVVPNQEVEEIVDDEVDSDVIEITSDEEDVGSHDTDASILRLSFYNEVDLSSLPFFISRPVSLIMLSDILRAWQYGTSKVNITFLTLVYLTFCPVQYIFSYMYFCINSRDL